MLGRVTRRTMATTAAALLTCIAAAGTADAARVSATPLFSIPGLNGIQIAIVDAIERTPENGTIQASTWAFSDVAVADALIKANAERNVSVEVMVGGKSADFEAVKKLQWAFDNPIPGLDKPASNVYVSVGPARASAAFEGATFGAMHQKSWTFSRVGRTKYVSIVTSANVTDNANAEQFNDGYRFVNDKRPYDVLRSTFLEQRTSIGKPGGAPFKIVPVGKRRTFTFGPWNAVDAARPDIGDPVVKRINALPNKVAIRAGNAQWTGARGLAIAQALAAKKAAGANVKVLHNPTKDAENKSDPAVLAVLDAAKIPHQVVSEDPALYLHGKFMIAKYGSQTRVWTGSENWSDDVRASDELTAMLTDRKAFSKFNRWFNTLWARKG